MLDRADVFPVQPLLGQLKDQREKFKEYDVIDGLIVKITSQRYKVFQKSIKCCICGIEADFFAAEIETGQPSKGYHLNLYALDEEWNQILMTKDHIKPRSKGGKNSQGNYQTMCTACNGKKGDKQ